MNYLLSSRGTLLFLFFLCGPISLFAEATYKLATFSVEGRSRLGLIISENAVVDFVSAAENLKGDAEAPMDMKNLIASYAKWKPFLLELAAVIGSRLKNGTVEEAEKAIFGYTVMIDVSDRGKAGTNTNFGSNWFPWKSHDGFAPLGPWIVPAEFIGDPHDLHLTLKVNGKVMQDASTADMIHTPEELVANASTIATLEVGDVIAAGTPSGVGAGRNPPIFLKPGDRVEATIEQIGTLSQPVLAELD